MSFWPFKPKRHKKITKGPPAPPHQVERVVLYLADNNLT